MRQGEFARAMPTEMRKFLAAAGRNREEPRAWWGWTAVLRSTVPLTPTQVHLADSDARREAHGAPAGGHILA